ncbi:MAG: glycosyltransferase family 4 protein [Vicinamibacterales bacterium]
MSVLILAQGPVEVASSRTRVFAYLPYLERAGIDYELLVWNSGRFIARTLRGAVPVVEHLRNEAGHARVLAALLARAGRHETVYVQKVVLPPWVLGRLKAGGRRLVFDYDDALYALAPGQDRGLRAWPRRRRIRRFLRVLDASDLVVIENDENRRVTEAHCPRTLSITGPIDTARYRPAARAPRPEVVLGWVGSPSTTGYLEMLRPALAELARRGHAVRLHLVGASRFESADVPVRLTPWTLAGEVAALEDFDVGLMPLTDDPWSRGKGGYKLLQYMAMGIPSVASPVGINDGLLRDGDTGFLPPTAGDWFEALERLVTDAALRRAMGARARDEAVARHSLDHHAPALIDALVPGRGGPGAPGGTDRRSRP